MSLDTDVLILGGGCAGLSLATALSQSAPHLHVHILEPRTQYRRDRTWCFWSAEPHLFSDGITHHWQSWRIRSDGTEARQRSCRYTYDHLPADRFYQIATAAIERSGHALSMGVEAQTPHQQKDFCEVQTNLGDLRSRWVFDSRPRVTALRPVIIQRFLGWHVQTARACFDPSVVDLMDFQPGTHPGRTTFFYLLPFSPTEALVEATFLDDPALPPPDADTLLRQYLERLPTGGYQVLYQEAGALPMGDHTPPTPSTTHIVDIGTRGGRVKPSSGYAFLRIQRQSTALAKALAAGTPLPTTVDPPCYSLLDAIFLRALKRTPERTSLYFMALFRRLPPDTLVRFLSETAGAAEIAHVMLALPKLDFLQAALLRTKALPA